MTARDAGIEDVARPRRGRDPAAFTYAASRSGAETGSDDVSLLLLVREERADLVAFLATLAPEQWQAPALCEGWRVHDVVAHMVTDDELGAKDLAVRTARGRCHLDRAATGPAPHCGRRPSAELVALLRAHQGLSGLSAMWGVAIGLTDALIHHQDIRRALGMPRDIPAERLVPALRTALFAPTLRDLTRVWGVRLVATDADWSFGRGPEVRGPAEALLMSMAGRRGALADLFGPGLATVTRRIPG